MFKSRSSFKATGNTISYVKKVLVGFVQDVYIVYRDSRYAIVAVFIGSDYTIV